MWMYIYLKKSKKKYNENKKKILNVHSNLLGKYITVPHSRIYIIFYVHLKRRNYIRSASHVCVCEDIYIYMRVCSKDRSYYVPGGSILVRCHKLGDAAYIYVMVPREHLDSKPFSPIS